MKLTYEGLKKLIVESIIEETRKTREFKLKSYIDKGYFVHFSDLNKLGINPKSEYETPLGIYAYPLTYEIYDQIMDDHLPFAGERLYLHIFKPREGTNIINLDIDTFSREDEFAYVKKLQEILPKRRIDLYHQESFSAAKFYKMPGGRFWYMTYALKEDSLDWNKLFRKLGIDGVVDLGMGIIHSNEPSQAVFFTKSVIDHVDTIENPSKHSERIIHQNKLKSQRNLMYSKGINLHKELKLFNLLLSNNSYLPKELIEKLNLDFIKILKAKFTVEKYDKIIEKLFLNYSLHDLDNKLHTLIHIISTPEINKSLKNLFQQFLIKKEYDKFHQSFKNINKVIGNISTQIFIECIENNLNLLKSNYSEDLDNFFMNITTDKELTFQSPYQSAYKFQLLKLIKKVTDMSI